MVEDAAQVLHRVQRRLASAATPAAMAATSAVLVPLIDHPRGTMVLFTLRSRSLSRHAGEVSFPGGRIEAVDTGPQAAALRETQEEVGIPADRVNVVAHLEEFLTFRNEVVSAHVGWIEADALPPTPAVSTEVEQSILVPLAELLGPAVGASHDTHGPEASLPAGLHVCQVTGYEVREFVGSKGPERIIHYWRLANGATVWGITGHLVATLLERLYDWRPTVPVRPIRGQDQVLP